MYPICDNANIIDVVIIVNPGFRCCFIVVNSIPLNIISSSIDTIMSVIDNIR